MKEGKYLRLSNISQYVESLALANAVWKMVLKWDYFVKSSLGLQFVRAVDSISANIAEGFGRYNKKDKIKFYCYAMGSAWESMDWLQKAFVRDLISKEEYTAAMGRLKIIPKGIHILIKITNAKLSD